MFYAESVNVVTLQQAALVQHSKLLLHLKRNLPLPQMRSETKANDLHGLGDKHFITVPLDYPD